MRLLVLETNDVEPNSEPYPEPYPEPPELTYFQVTELGAGAAEKLPVPRLFVSIDAE